MDFQKESKVMVVHKIDNEIKTGHLSLFPPTRSEDRYLLGTYKLQQQDKQACTRFPTGNMKHYTGSVKLEA